MLYAIIPRLGLPRSLQSDSGTSFTSKVTQGVSKALDITYYLHCAWRPQSSGKVERANQFLKSVIKKITQKTSRGWKEALPVALLCTHIAPKEQAGFSPQEMLYGRPFVHVNDLLLGPEPRPSSLYHGHWAIPTGYALVGCISTRIQKILESPLYAPGAHVLIKVWNDGSPKV